MYCGGTVTPSVTLKNFGTNPLTSVQIIVTANGTTLTTYNWTGNIAPNQTAIVTLPQVNIPNGNINFVVTTSSPNGQTDEGTNNDSSTANVTISANPNPLQITVRTDCYGTETRWRLTNEGSSTQIIGGGNTSISWSGGTNGYNGNSPSAYANNTVYTTNTCVPNGCYTFTIVDAYNDGLAYAQCPTPGMYEVTNGNSYNYVTMSDANFGNAVSHSFCINAVSNTEIISESLIIFPNPSNGNLTIKYDQQIANSEITVLDLTGRVVFTATMNNSEQGFDLEHLAKGKYLVNVKAENVNISKSIVLQ